MSKYRILSFDGGGIRGALTIQLLKRLVDKVPSLLKKVDLFAGTSTGSFIALGLAYGKSPEELTKLYCKENAEFIFTPEYTSLLRPQYNNRNLKTLLQTIFPPKLPLKKLNSRVLIPAFRIVGKKNWESVFFHNFPDSKTKHISVLEAALASCAAPTYFPSYNHYIDGGVIANNPSTAAVAIAKGKAPAKYNLKDIYLLSIGTGIKPNEIKDTENWGILQWAINPSPPPTLPLLNVLIEGGIETNYQLTSQLLDDRCFRINPLLPEAVSLDEYHRIPVLIKLANNYNLKPAFNWLIRNWV